MYPFNFKMGQKIQTDASGVAVDRAFLAHLNVLAAAAIAASSNGILAAANLGAATQSIIAGITNPAVPRALSVTGNLAGVVGDVVITGTNYNGDTITEAIAANGTATVGGTKAFKTITSIGLPVQVHTPVAQVETATVVGTVSTAGNATVTVTAAGMTGSPKAISVAVALSDDATAVAGKIRTALVADTAVTALFTVGGTGASVILTSKTPAVNDTTLNIAIDNGTCAGLTAAPTSANTTAGVQYDTIAVGFSEILGVPYKLAHNTVRDAYLNNVRESIAPTVAVSTTALESNTIKLNSALNGSVVDVYLVV